MRKVFVLTLIVLSVLGGGFVVLSNVAPVQDRVFDRAVEQRLAAGRPVLSDDSLYIYFCGTGSPLPDPTRANACTAIIAGGDIYLVDVAPGSSARLQNSNLDLARIKGVFLTHFHSDHIGDLGEIGVQSWVAGRSGPLPVFGPEGVEDVAEGFSQAYAFDESYRVAHHTDEYMPAGGLTFDPRLVEPMEVGGLKITPIEVDHAPIRPALGYRFDYKGRSVVISGDTVKTQTLAAAAQGVDVLIHEALSMDLMGKMAAQLGAAGQDRMAQLATDTLDYHTSPVEAAELANEAGVELLVLTHIVPPIPNSLIEKMFLRGVSDIRGTGVSLGYDGLFIELPGGSTDIYQRDGVGLSH
jgi:ribonuclease Z